MSDGFPESFMPEAEEQGSEQATESENMGGESGQDIPPKQDDDCKSQFGSRELSCIAADQSEGFEPARDGWSSTSAGWRSVYADLHCGGDR